MLTILQPAAAAARNYALFAARSVQGAIQHGLNKALEQSAIVAFMRNYTDKWRARKSLLFWRLARIRRITIKPFVPRCVLYLTTLTSSRLKHKVQLNEMRQNDRRQARISACALVDSRSKANHRLSKALLTSIHLVRIQ